MALPNGVLVHRFVQTTTAVVIAVLLQSALSRPKADCSKRYPVARTHLLGTKESLGSQSAVAWPQIVGLPDMGNLLQVERFTLPCFPLLLIQDFRDPPITIIVQQTVDLGNHLRLRLSKLSDWQWLGDSQGPGGAATEAHMNLDHFSIDQRHVFDEQT